LETTSQIYVFRAVDYYIIFGYLGLLTSIGFILKRLCGGAKDYLIGGNQIPWWLAGASVFMMSFSAWTFTGAAGFAYEHGILIILLFYFSVVAYWFAGRFLAARIRQTRRVTFGEILHDRFGRMGEQFFVWIQFPNMLFGGAIWLLGLAVFVSVAFGVPMPVTILVTGGVILIYSTLSGSWGVMTTDFLQSIILLILTTVVAALTLIEEGGITHILERLEPDKLSLASDEHSWVWIVAYFAQISIIFNSVLGANRYLAVRTGRSARKAAYLAALLFALGPLVWFIPPLVASYRFPNLSELLPGLPHASDGAYVMMGLDVLPPGLAGLLVMVIFAATLSSMDTAINVNAGILCMNVYKPLFRPKADEQELLKVSRVFNVLCGLIVVISAYALSTVGTMNLFDLMLLLSAGIGLPLALPCVLLFVFRRTPRWAAVVGVLASGAFSFFAVTSDWHLFARVFGIIGINVLVFGVARLFWHSVTELNQKKISAFYDQMETPINESSELRENVDTGHLKLVGRLAMLVGGGLMVGTAFPNEAGGRLLIGMTALTLISIGLLLEKVARSTGSQASKR
jgi:Na+/proline symporter